MIRVMVSGGFDPLHKGHIQLFKEAKKLGHKLIVAVNSTDFLVNKKGYEFMEWDERCLIINELEIVDEVVKVVDEDNTVRETLREVRPDIFANGGDRNNREIPEAEVCEELKIIMADGLGRKIQSSSELVEKMKGAE